MSARVVTAPEQGIHLQLALAPMVRLGFWIENPLDVPV